MIGDKFPPLLKYPGGKQMLADWVISHFPPHIAYAEPFAGSASVLIRKTRVKNEILNDLDDEVASLFRVMSDRERATELIRRIKFTPYSENLLREIATHRYDTDEDRAWKVYVMSWLSRSYHLRKSAQTLRIVVNNDTGGHAPASTFARVRHLYRISQRLRGVQILCRDYREVMRMCDRPDVLIYLDPPYLGLTRGNRNYYNHELLGANEHLELLQIANRSRAMIAISGYASDLYARELAHWTRFDKSVRDGSVKRNVKIETLYLNKRAMDKKLKK